jgi:hypothetical protein
MRQHSRDAGDVPADAGQRLLSKLRDFSRTLESDERALLGALIAPAVAQAHDDAEVVAFGAVDWAPDLLPDALARAVRESGIRVVGLDGA